MRHSEERRTYVDVDMGPVIQKNMNRCIHCTRCIRFGEEVAGIHEMVAIQRGNNIDITTIDGLPLKTEYAGNYSDICPTGSLTLKDFRFQKRAWMLKKTATICEGCSKGCNMEVQHEGNRVYRCVPRENLSINKYWMCDEGRMNYHYTQSADRLLAPMVGAQAAGWDLAIDSLRNTLQEKSVLFLVASDLTNEEIQVIKAFAMNHAPHATFAHFGTVGVATTKDDGKLDEILRMKSKTSNLNGIENAGIKPYQNQTADAVVVFRGGRAQMLAIAHALNAAKTRIGIGVFLQKEAVGFQSILPGHAFTEKEGTIVNHQGQEQKFMRATLPRSSTKAISEILMLAAHQKKGKGAA
jgi:NADH-quinone oxidoreductase subunit G